MFPGDNGERLRDGGVSPEAAPVAEAHDRVAEVDEGVDELERAVDVTRLQDVARGLTDVPADEVTEAPTPAFEQGAPLEQRRR